MEVIEESNEPSDPLITGQNEQLSAFAKRRASLLAQKQQQQPQPSNLGNDAVNHTMLDRVTGEFRRFVLHREKVVCNINPQKWWAEHELEFPLLSRFYRAHCAFQSTSTSSERVFSAENLIVSDSRKSLCPERAESLLITRDYLIRRQNNDAYRLCEKCPLPPSKNASYVINCGRHNN